MNLANSLTILRMCLVPFFVLFMELGGFFCTILALIIFCIAAVTDFFDGRIARKYKTVTYIGAFLDPLADKLLLSSAFIYFVGIPYLGIASWMVIAIIFREFLITGFRSVAACKNVIIPADKYGKFKTILQILLIIITLVIVVISEAFVKYTGVPIDFLKFYDIKPYSYIITIVEKIPYWFTFFTALFTVFSGANYVFKYRNLLSGK